jgi:hypothetical protein
MARLLTSLALLVSLFCTAFGCADDDGAQGERSVSLSGTVRDGQTGGALKGVRVEFLADTGEKAADTTDKSGHYGVTLQTLSPLGRLTASKAGYRTRTVTTFADDNDVRQDIDLLKE